MAHWNRMDRTITQNGALYAVQHRSAKTYPGNLRKKEAPHWFGSTLT